MSEQSHTNEKPDEVSIILAALRHLQRAIENGENLSYLDDICDVENVDSARIDVLCEIINVDDKIES